MFTGTVMVPELVLNEVFPAQLALTCGSPAVAGVKLTEQLRLCASAPARVHAVGLKEPEPAGVTDQATSGGLVGAVFVPAESSATVAVQVVDAPRVIGEGVQTRAVELARLVTATVVLPLLVVCLVLVL